MKNKLKKALSLVLCLVLLTSMMGSLAGCKDNSSVNGEDRHIVMVYFYGTKLPKDVDMVEAAINEHLKELGSDITIEYYPMSVFNQTYTTSLMTDPIDLMCLAFGNSPQFYYELDMIQSITMEEMEQYCPDIVKMNEDYEMFVRSYTGEILGVATREIAIATGGCYLIRQSDLEAIGMADQYQDNSFITLEELEGMFAKLKDKFPDSYPISAQMDESWYYAPCDPLGGGVQRATGVLDFSNGMDTTKVVNYYETETYVEYCKFMANCLKNGWLDPESETGTTAKNTQFNNGIARGVWLNGNPLLRDSWSTDSGEACVRLHVMTPFSVPARNDAITWAVSGTSNKKAATLEFLNLFWSDQKLMNLVQWGIEGTHFKVLDQENGIIDFADGINAETSGYYMGGGFYADKRYVYTYQSSALTLEEQIEAKKDDIRFGEWAEERPSPAGNFIFNASAHKIAIENIEAVISRYANIMSLGGYTDEVYATFLAELKKAGLDAVMADKQAQLDAYLAGID